MPIYEYRCDSCGHEFETIQKVSEDPLQTCPECEHSALVKKISAAGFRLKGGGWYETDFKSGNKRNVSGDNNESGQSTSGSSSDSSSSSDNGAKTKDKGSTDKSTSSSKKND